MLKLLAFAALALAPAAALAQTSASVTVTNDYVARGTSQNFGDPAAILYVDHQTKSGFYASAVVAYVDFDDDETFYDGTKLEADIFAGYRGTAGEASYEIGVAQINYVGTKPTLYNPGGNWNMFEVHVAASHPVGKATVGAYVGVTPDYFNNYGKAVWGEVSVSYPVTSRLTAKTAFARQQFFEKSSIGIAPEVSNYNTWNVGLNYAITKSFSVDVRYYDTDTDYDLGSIYRPRVAVALTKGF